MQPRELALPTFDSFADEGGELDFGFDDGSGTAGAEGADFDTSVDGDFEMGEVGGADAAAAQALRGAGSSHIEFDIGDADVLGGQPTPLMDQVRLFLPPRADLAACQPPARIQLTLAPARLLVRTEPSQMKRSASNAVTKLRRPGTHEALPVDDSEDFFL